MGHIRAGKLDRLVTIQQRGAAGHDGYTKTKAEWATVARRRASVQPARGREVEEASGRSGMGVMSFWMRYDSVTGAITEKHSLLLDGRRYDIAAPPMEVGRREGIEIYATASELTNTAAE